jgi:hypothetical protein
MAQLPTKLAFLPELPTVTQIQVGTNGFVYLDLADAQYASGAARAAKKILTDGAVALARNTTYGFASLGLPGSGASAGVSFGTGDRGEAITEFCAAFTAAQGNEVPDTVDLTGAGEFAQLPAGPLAQLGDTAAALHVASTLAVAMTWLGSTPATAMVTGAGPVADLLRERLTAQGTELKAEADPSGPAIDVAFLGTGGGELTHLNLSAYPASTILGFVPNSITARGLAEAKRAGVAVLPEFVAAAGPLIAYAAETVATAAGNTEDQVAANVAQFIEQIDRHSESGPYLEACFAAEAFMSTWTASLPFGRPLA